MSKDLDYIRDKLHDLLGEDPQAIVCGIKDAVRAVQGEWDKGNNIAAQIAGGFGGSGISWVNFVTFVVSA